MATACIFCIGTGHTHVEKANVLVKLWEKCAFQDLGVEGNHSADNIGGVPNPLLGTWSRSKAPRIASSASGTSLASEKASVTGLETSSALEKASVTGRPGLLPFKPLNGGFKWINEGQNWIGGGINAQTKANAD